MKYSFTDTTAFIFHIGYPLVIYMTASAAAELIAGSGSVIANGNGMLVTMSAAAVMAAVILGIVYSKSRQYLPPPKSPGFSVYIWILVMAFGGCVFFNELITRCGIFFRVRLPSGAWLYESPLYLQIAAAGILVPVAEELVFRGLGYMQMRTRLTFVRAAVISSVYFAVYHGSIIQGLYAFALGVMMAWICEQYNLLRLSVWFHISANICSIIITDLNRGQEVKPPLWLTLVVSAAMILTGIYKIREDVNKHEIVINSNSLL